MKLTRTLLFTFLSLVLSLFLFGILNYEGHILYYLVFSIISNFSILYSFRKSSIFFETFLSIFLWLGFWFKFTIQISFFEKMFPEGVGDFNFLPASYDEAILISTCGILSLIVFSYFREKFYFKYETLEKKLELNLNSILLYKKFRKKIIIISLFFITSICIVNYFFSFSQKGTISFFILPLGLNNFFSWAMMFGLSSILSFIIYQEFLIKKKDKNILINYSFFESLITSISSLSRAMIFNSSAILFGYFRLLQFRKIKIKEITFLKYLIILMMLFLISLIVVSNIRQNNDFPINENVKNLIPEVTNNTNNGNPINLNKLIFEANQIILLVSGRWVGIDAVMAVQANKYKGFTLLKKSLGEEFNYSNSFYENKIKKNYYEYKEKPKIYTIYVPGIIAYLYYSNSISFIIFSMMFLCLICSTFEYYSYKISKGNLIFCSLIGNVLAYRLAHFGYMPSNSFKIILAITLNLILFYLVFWLINKIQK